MRPVGFQIEPGVWLCCHSKDDAPYIIRNYAKYEYTPVAWQKAIDMKLVAMTLNDIGTPEWDKNPGVTPLGMAMISIAGEEVPFPL